MGLRREGSGLVDQRRDFVMTVMSETSIEGKAK